MRRLASLFLAFAFCAAAFAQEPEPPGRVGRVAWTQGEVALFADPERDWEKAYVNSPLTTENSLWTEAAARAELRIGSTALRLDEFTQLDIRRLDDEQLVAHVVRGALAVRIRHFESGERYVISTPFARFHLLGNGRYRIDTDEVTEASRLSVFAGAAQLETSGRRVNVRVGEAVNVQSDRGNFDFERAEPTPFDDWALGRDERLVDRETTRYVSPRMTGYEDLETYGSWSQDPEHGAIWYPSRVAEDYVPYRNGNWVYTRPWGWTWVDQAPWGYAPFHYGRWVHAGNRWGWCPGRYVARPVWAPALVGWVGRPGWSVTIGAGTAPVVGWYPLAPHDRYRPWYTNNPRYADRVNSHVRERPNNRPRGDDRDRHPRDRGTTIVSREGFVNQRPVSSSIVAVPGDVVAAQPLTTGVAVLPSRREIPMRKPLQDGPATAVMQKPVSPARGVDTVRGDAPSFPAPVAPSASARAITSAPNYRAPVANTPSALPPREPQARDSQSRAYEPRPQTKPVRVAPSSPVTSSPAPAARAPVEPVPSARARQVEEPPAAAPQAKPSAREATPRETVVEKPERADSAPAPIPMQKPLRVQQR